MIAIDLAQVTLVVIALTIGYLVGIGKTRRQFAKQLRDQVGYRCQGCRHSFSFHSANGRCHHLVVDDDWRNVCGCQVYVGMKPVEMET